MKAINDTYTHIHTFISHQINLIADSFEKVYKLGEWFLILQCTCICEIKERNVSQINLIIQIEESVYLFHYIHQ